MDKKEPNKIIGVDTFRERKAEQLIRKLEYDQIGEAEFIIGMLRLGYSTEVVSVILNDMFEEE